MNEKVVKVIDLVPGNRIPLATVQARSLNEQTFWTEFVCMHTPVIVKGAIAEWSALERWRRVGYLEERCGNEVVEVSRTFNAGPILKNAATQSQRLADCINEMRRASDDATYSIPGLPVPEKWRADLGGYSFLGRKYERTPLWYPRRRLFVYKNASTEWHYHNLDETVTSQLVGTKRISLFRLNAENWHAFAPLIEANWHHMSCGRRFFPEGATLRKYEGVIDAGDAIYVPPFWWHGVDPADTGLGVTLAHCFRSPVRRLGAWEEPVTRVLVGRVSRSHKARLLPLLALLSCSSISRMLHHEKWWPM